MMRPRVQIVVRNGWLPFLVTIRYSLAWLEKPPLSWRILPEKNICRGQRLFVGVSEATNNGTINEYNYGNIMGISWEYRGIETITNNDQILSGKLLQFANLNIANLVR